MSEKRVLFVNNSPDVQEKVRAILSQQDDYNLIIAQTAEEADKILEKETVNFVLFDVDVALDEGVNKMILMKEKYPDIPIVATTPIKKGEPGDAIAPQLRETKGLIGK